MTNTKDSIRKLAAFRAGIREHQGMAQMAKADPERLGKFWGGRAGSTSQRVIVADLVADALNLSGAALAAFNRGRDAGLRAA